MRESLPYTRFLLFVSALLVATCGFCADPAPKPIAGVFSNLTFIPEGGDLLGIELFIVPGGRPNWWTAFVQIADGGHLDKATVEFEVVGSHVEFTVPDKNGGDRTLFVGDFKRGELLLQWPKGKVEHLKRGKSHWQ